MRVTLFVLLLGTVLVFGVIALATATSSDDGRHSRIEIDTDSIFDLAAAAESDADRMDSHATAMLFAAASRPDLASWASEAEVARADAQSLRFLADSARAIHHDLQTFPVSSDAMDLSRLLANGRNLEWFGRTILAHAGAMEAHVAPMRRDAGQDAALSAAIETLAIDVSVLRTNGENAVHQGQEMTERALTLARSVGITLE